MTIDKLLAIVQARGLRLVMTVTGPALRGDKRAATPRLIRVLKVHKAEIVAKLPPAEPAPEVTKPLPPSCRGCWLCCGCRQHGAGGAFVPCVQCEMAMEAAMVLSGRIGE